MKSELEKFLEGWAKSTGLAEVASGTQGDYFLLFDNEYEVRLSQSLRLIRLEADLGEIQNDRSAASAMLDELMALQLACTRDAAEVLAIDDDTGRLVLFSDWQANRLNAELFAGALSQFVNGYEFWTREIKALRAPSASPLAPMAIVHA